MLTGPRKCGISKGVPKCFGFEIVGPLNQKRRLIDWRAAFLEYANLDERIDSTCEAYTSAFTFADDFRKHLEATGSTKGFDGVCRADFIWFDIDRVDLEVARCDTARLALLLTARYQLDDDSLLIFFSGGKGFHVGLPTDLWLPPASLAFNAVARRLAEGLAASAKVDVDPIIYDKVRAFRAPNSRHPKTGLHKRRLSLDELTRHSINRIQKLAMVPTPFDLPTVSTRCEQAEADWNDAAQTTREKIKRIQGKVPTPFVVDEKTPIKRKRSRCTDSTDRTESTSVRSVLSVLSVQRLQQMIEETLPPRFGTRRNKLFVLARRIRADTDFREIPLSDLKSILRTWHQKALPNIEHKDFDWTWGQFVEAYGNVDLTRCLDPVEEAMKRADATELPPEALQYDSMNSKRLVALCAELSRGSTDGVFFVSCRKAANAIGIPDHTEAARMLKMLCADGVLLVTEPGGPHNNQATRYRYLGQSEKRNH